MRRFSQLIEQLNATNSTNEKVEAMVRYLHEAPEEDQIWMVGLFCGRKPARPVKSSLLKQWVAEATTLPFWLFEDAYHTVGDLSETISLLLHGEGKTDLPLHQIMYQLIDLKQRDETYAKSYLFKTWHELDQMSCFVFNKFLTGGFRIGVSQKLLTKALALRYQLPENTVAHKLMGNWEPSNTTLSSLLQTEHEQDISKPYPFYLAYPLEQTPETLGECSEWQIEYKWDGIRGQIIQRNGQLFVWTRGEELLTDRFPELHVLMQLPDGTVLDGEILAFDEKPLDFSLLQTRLSRKNVGKKDLLKAPVKFVAYDLLEYEGQDLRSQSLQTRRELLEKLVLDFPQDCLLLSPLMEANNWQEVADFRQLARERAAEGLMLKRKTSTYQVGRKRGDWWKWKIDPYTIDAVLVYAMSGHGRRANLFTDYTFAVWENDELVTFTKAYSGLTDKELQEVDQFVKKNTLEKFGPVRKVQATLVFEIAFEGIAASTRHKSGIALRFPRIARWRKDKPASEANTKQDLMDLLHKVKPN